MKKLSASMQKIESLSSPHNDSSFDSGSIPLCDHCGGVLDQPHIIEQLKEKNDAIIYIKNKFKEASDQLQELKGLLGQSRTEMKPLQENLQALREILHDFIKPMRNFLSLSQSPATGIPLEDRIEAEILLINDADEKDADDLKMMQEGARGLLEEKENLIAYLNTSLAPIFASLGITPPAAIFPIVSSLKNLDGLKGLWAKITSELKTRMQQGRSRRDALDKQKASLQAEIDYFKDYIIRFFKILEYAPSDEGSRIVVSALNLTSGNFGLLSRIQAAIEGVESARQSTQILVDEIKKLNIDTIEEIKKEQNLIIVRLGTLMPQIKADQNLTGVYESLSRVNPEGSDLTRQTQSVIKLLTAERQRREESMKGISGLMSQIQLSATMVEELKRRLNPSFITLSDEAFQLKLIELQNAIDKIQQKIAFKDKIRDCRRMSSDISSVLSRYRHLCEDLDNEQETLDSRLVLQGIFAPNGEARTMALSNDAATLVASTNTLLRSISLDTDVSIDVKMEKDDDNTPMLEIEFELDGDKNVSILPSESQRKIVSMCTDIALRNLSNANGFILIDEPESGLTDRNKQKVSKFLRSVAPQVLIVTNEKASSSSSDFALNTAEIRESAPNISIADFDIPKKSAVGGEEGAAAGGAKARKGKKAAGMQPVVDTAALEEAVTLAQSTDDGEI
jgi:ABC-type lipoprotein export system ATPase subunit